MSKISKLRLHKIDSGKVRPEEGVQKEELAALGGVNDLRKKQVRQAGGLKIQKVFKQKNQ